MIDTHNFSRKYSARLMLIGAASMLVLVAIAGIVYIAKEHGKSTTNTESTAAIVYVDVTDQGFSPSDLAITPGSTVVWTNKTNAASRIIASVTSAGDRPLFDSGTSVLGPQAQYRYTFPENGDSTYSYYDAQHPLVHGHITVSPAASR